MKRLILLTVAILAFCGIFAQAVNPTIWQGTQGQPATNQTPWYNGGGCGWSCAYIDSLINAHGGGGSGWSLTGNAGTNSGHNYFGTVDNASLNIITNNTTRLFIDSINNSIFGSAAQLYIGSTGSSFNTNFIADGAYFDQYNTNCSGYNNSLFDGSYGPYYCNGVNFYNNITASGSYEGYYSVGGTYSYNCAFGESYPDYEDSTTDFYANAFFGDAYTEDLVNCDFYENICNGEAGSAYNEHSSTMDYNFSNYGTISAYGLDNSIYYGLIQGYESYGAFHDTSCYLQNYFIANGGIGTENQKGVSSSNFTVIGTGAVGNCSNCFVVDLGDGQQYGTNGEFSIFGSGSPAFKLVDGTQSSGYVLTSDASGNASWRVATGGGWGLTGNAGTNSAINFLGTTDTAGLSFRALSNQLVGLIDNNDNTALGIDALMVNGTGDINVAIGAYALEGNTVGEGNSAMGYSALGDNTTGNYNTGIGSEALVSNSTGSNLTAFGANADVGIDGLTNANAFGYNARVSCSYCTVIGDNTSANMVGIGTDTPSTYLTETGLAVIGQFNYRDNNQAASEVLTSDANGNASWINTLNFTAGNTSVDYQNGTLWDGSHGFPVMQWKSSLLTDLGGNTSVDWQNRIAYDNSGVEDMSWGNGVGIDTATIRSAAIGNTTDNSSIVTILNNHSNVSVDTVSYGSFNGGLMEMTYPAGGGGNDNSILNIVSTGDASGNWGSAIAFYTRPNGGTTNVMQDVVRITNVGNVYLTQPASGFILTDANGACWLYTASITTGVLVPSTIACPSH